MYAAEGSGSMQDFRETITRGLLPEGSTAWEASEWTTIEIDGQEAHKRELAAVLEMDQRWRLYVVDGGKFYYAIIQHASELVMEPNGGFYENLVQDLQVRATVRGYPKIQFTQQLDI